MLAGVPLEQLALSLLAPKQILAVALPAFVDDWLVCIARRWQTTESTTAVWLLAEGAGYLYALEDQGDTAWRTGPNRWVIPEGPTGFAGSATVGSEAPGRGLRPAQRRADSLGRWLARVTLRQPCRALPSESTPSTESASAKPANPTGHEGSEYKGVHKYDYTLLSSLECPTSMTPQHDSGDVRRFGAGLQLFGPPVSNFVGQQSGRKKYRWGPGGLTARCSQEIALRR